MAETLISLTERAGALKREGRLDDAIGLYAQAARDFPASAVAEHNLAGALGDAGRDVEAEHHARLAFAKGLDAPETWLVLARSLQGQLRMDEALAAYQTALDRRPAMMDAQMEWAQLVWMRTGDAQAALARIDAAIARSPGDPALRLGKARIVDFTQGAVAAHACIADALALRPGDPDLLVAASHMATMAGDESAALGFAVDALRASPGRRDAIAAYALACLATGDGAGADEAAQALLKTRPHDQHALAIQATAWRLLGDPRYQQIYDYKRFVGSYRLVVPGSWSTLDSYVRDLANALKRHHPFRTHPFGHSVRQGSQLANLLAVDDPAIKAFPEALAPAVDAHLRMLGRGDDPHTSRNTGRWRFSGIWSVWLKPGGFHVDHVHQEGWLSSACYVELPPAVSAGGQAGWLKFGEPGAPTRPHLGPEHAIRPEPGMTAIFPSYMWHGTVPFSGDEPRLTIAFDIVPA